MSVAPQFDGDPFQLRLAVAFILQETGIEAHSLYGLIRIQHLIANHENDSNDIMQLIAERAGDVAHAAGIGIALLEGERLVYRAGVGTAAASMDKNLTAVLSASADGHPRTEILRVENAETDSRIEADICRQFGASALLMLPIYQGRISAGVLAVLFNERHTFRDREVRTYQLMARLVGESTSHQVEDKVEYKRSLTANQLTVPQAILRMTAEMQKVSRSQSVREPERRTGIVGASPAAAVRDWSSCWNLLRAGPLMRQAFRRASLNKLYWKLGSVPIVIALLAVCGWIGYRHRPLPVSDSAIPRVSPAEPQVPPVLTPEKQPKVQRGAGNNPPKSAFKRKRIGVNEVDYVTDDVTVRQFGPTSALKERRSRNAQAPIKSDISERAARLDHPPDKSR
jgi:hypothetical protein